ncbi:MAG: hypothetical protein ACU0BS_00600 [Hasllibacter sp.]
MAGRLGAALCAAALLAGCAAPVADDLARRTGPQEVSPYGEAAGESPAGGGVIITDEPIVE